ncbi:hypothetical protein BDR22DRAFT_972896 [Usnea florida]
MVSPTNEDIRAFKGDWGEAYHSPGPIAPGGRWPKCELLKRAEELIKIDAPQSVIDLAKKEPKGIVKTTEAWRYSEDYALRDHSRLMAVMIYSRGSTLHTKKHWCRCCTGEFSHNLMGPFPACISDPRYANGQCANCLFTNHSCELTEAVVSKIDKRGKLYKNWEYSRIKAPLTSRRFSSGLGIRLENIDGFNAGDADYEGEEYGPAVTVPSDTGEKKRERGREIIIHSRLASLGRHLSLASACNRIPILDELARLRGYTQHFSGQESASRSPLEIDSAQGISTTTGATDDVKPSRKKNLTLSKSATDLPPPPNAPESSYREDKPKRRPARPLGSVKHKKGFGDSSFAGSSQKRETQGTPVSHTTRDKRAGDVARADATNRAPVTAPTLAKAATPASTSPPAALTDRGSASTVAIIAAMTRGTELEADLATNATGHGLDENPTRDAAKAVDTLTHDSDSPDRHGGGRGGYLGINNGGENGEGLRFESQSPTR